MRLIGRLRLTLRSDLRLGCTEFPWRKITVRPPSAQVHRIELLETEGNVTGLALNMSSYQNVTGSGAQVSTAVNVTTAP